MTEVITKLKAYLVSPHLHFAWALVLLYLLVFGLAYLLARAGRSDRTILFRCRRAWAVALILHALFVTSLTIKWLLDYGYFPSFWSYFPWYLGMLIVDGYLIAAAMTSLGRFASYSQS